MNIVPIVTGVPAKTLTKLNIRVASFLTDATTTQLHYQLLTDTNEIVSTGVYTLTEPEFTNWGAENVPYLEDLVLVYLGVERLIEE